MKENLKKKRLLHVHSANAWQTIYPENDNLLARIFQQFSCLIAVLTQKPAENIHIVYFLSFRQERKIRAFTCNVNANSFRDEADFIFCSLIHSEKID